VIMLSRTLLVVAAVAASLQAVPSRAHTELLQAVPKPEAVVEKSPEKISLIFSEEVDPAFSGMSLIDDNGNTIQVDGLSIAGKKMDTSISETLGEGIYRVNWHLLSIDGHRVEGSFTFEVAP
jgi:copper resistance protein C